MWVQQRQSLHRERVSQRESERARESARERETAVSMSTEMLYSCLGQDKRQLLEGEKDTDRRGLACFDSR